MTRGRILRDVAIFAVVAAVGAFMLVRSGPRDNAFDDGLPKRSFAPQDQYVPGELLVGFSDSEQRARIRALVGVRSFRVLPVPGIELWSLPADVSVRSAIDTVAALPGVRFVEPNMTFAAAALPNDPKFPSQWGLRNTGRTIDGKAGTRDADVDGPEAWAAARTRGSGTLVAVVDSGVAYNHRDIAANAWSNPREAGALGSNGLDDDGNGYVDDAHGWDWVDEDADPADPHGHGTHVAGTVVARAGDGFGVAGIAPDAEVVALRVLDPTGLGTSDAIAAAIVYAGRIGADVVNLSVVGPRSETVLAALSEVSDAVVVAAAGNDGLDLSDSPTYPCGYEIANLICVGASDSVDALANFSNRSGPVDIAAPGNHILSAKPSFVTPLAADFETDLGWSLGAGWTRLQDASGHFLAAGDDVPPESAAVTEAPADLSGVTGCTLVYVAKVELGAGARAAMEAEIGGTWTEVAALTDADNGGWKRYSFDVTAVDGARSRFRYILSGTGTVALDDVVIRCVAPTARGHEFRSGTSMASPFVAGVAALLRVLDPELTPAESIAALTATGDKVGSLDGAVGCGCRLNALAAARSVTR